MGRGGSGRWKNQGEPRAETPHLAARAPRSQRRGQEQAGPQRRRPPPPSLPAGAPGCHCSSSLSPGALALQSGASPAESKLGGVWGLAVTKRQPETRPEDLPALPGSPPRPQPWTCVWLASRRPQTATSPPNPANLLLQCSPVPGAGKALDTPVPRARTRGPEGAHSRRGILDVWSPPPSPSPRGRGAAEREGRGPDGAALTWPPGPGRGIGGARLSALAAHTAA